jgi:hypothetical protein
MLAAPVAAHLAYTSLRLTLGTAATTRALAGAHGGLVPRRLRFVVLLPMLREDQALEAACQHLAAAIRSGVPLDVVVATSPQETDERDAAQAELLRLIGRGDKTGWTP